MGHAIERRFHSASITDTTALACQIAPHLCAGDTLLLDGPVGAGKSLMCREIIRARLMRDEDIPSPTFTLVQTYDAGDVEIWHSDLYRISGVDELIELGLEDAFETAISLVEWPARLGNFRPKRFLSLVIGLGDGLEERRIDMAGIGAGWDWVTQIKL